MFTDWIFCLSCTYSSETLPRSGTYTIHRQFCTSPELLENLHAQHIHACWTVGKNRRGMPGSSSKPRRGAVEVKHASNILTVKWMDKKEVNLLTTVHTNGMVETGKIDRTTGQPRNIPVCVEVYNQKIGPVDRSGHMIVGVQPTRKTIKWYKNS